MDYILYLLIFCIGTVFGSFFTLAVYRIPLRQDITHTRSYCPKCNHKLSFWDMIPILSYVFLGGKCRYCGQKIRPRYLMLEVMSGIVFVLFAISVKLSIFDIIFLDKQLIAYFITGLLYIATLFIIAGIDKENVKIEKPVLLFGFICVTIYMIYLYIVEINTNVYRYVIYLIVFGILTIINTFILRKNAKGNYTIDILLLLTFMLSFTYEFVCIFSVIITLIAISLQLIIKNILAKKSKCVKTEIKEYTKLPIGFYLCTANIITLIVGNIFIFYNW